MKTPGEAASQVSDQPGGVLTLPVGAAVPQPANPAQTAMQDAVGVAAEVAGLRIGAGALF